MLEKRSFRAPRRKKAKPEAPPSVTDDSSGCGSRSRALEGPAAELVLDARLARRKWWSTDCFECASVEPLLPLVIAGSECFRALLNSVICRDISAAISGPVILVTSNDLREAFEECDFMSRPQMGGRTAHGYRLDPRFAPR